MEILNTKTYLRMSLVVETGKSIFDQKKLKVQICLAFAFLQG